MVELTTSHENSPGMPGLLLCHGRCHSVDKLRHRLLPVRRAASPLAAVVAPRRLDSIDAQRDGNRLMNLLLIRHMSTAREREHRDGEKPVKSVRSRPSDHLKISLQRGLPLCGGYAPMRQRMEVCNPLPSIHRQS
ncbi:hypothetical protein HDE78_003394 [Rhodanobacter sp. K2T2]|uniref:hypothetical protein n=1 Tax=Rhodanobacter sp. K2T2 TaxID=2723085 RepID=UPI0015C82274|nr:hypothetical protein [Rhodanobacter sp. K2T2]NYE30424.1 hypothetical protein [Rhodanobacter sp. K2T2]